MARGDRIGGMRAHRGIDVALLQDEKHLHGLRARISDELVGSPHAGDRIGIRGALVAIGRGRVCGPRELRRDAAGTDRDDHGERDGPGS